MFDRLVEQFCVFDDFVAAARSQISGRLLSDGRSERRRGPPAGLVDSEIMTILIMYHESRFKNFKIFYNIIILRILRTCFPCAPCYERFLTLTKYVLPLLTLFLASMASTKTGIYYVDSTPLPVCHNKRISKHRVFEGLAARGRTSVGWFFGFKAHFIFNELRQVIAVKITPGNVHDTVPLPDLARNLSGKLFGDKGYVSKKVANILSERGLFLLTRPKKNMTPLPISIHDEILLKGRSIAETIIGHIKEFSSLRLPKHRSVPNAFTHIIAAIVAYQFQPLTLSPKHVANP
jgi:hypothetical protein